MESNNYKNGIPNSKYRHFNKRKDQYPYTRHRPNHINPEFLPSYPRKCNFQYHSDDGTNTNRNIYENNVNVSFNYDKRNHHNSANRSIKTNFYQQRERPYNQEKRHYSEYPVNNFVRPELYEQNTILQIFPNSSPEMSLTLESPQEAKTSKIISAIKSQKGVSGLLVLLQTYGDNASVILQNAVQSIKNGILSVASGRDPLSYELKINGEFIVKGEFINKQTAKNGLCQLALDKLRKTCFFITKKSSYEEISTEDLNKPQTESATCNGMEGSKAHMMMLKMGWGGKGLGINEQGGEKTVAETMTQSVAKEGLGGKSIMTKINNILIEFAHSTKVTTLAFDPGFTKEERAEIHNLAAKLNLKSKSEGNEENRRITIRKKIARWDLVKELLLTNCENEAYKLTIPSNFADIWVNE